MTKQGLIKTIIVIVIALIILGYFGFNIGDIINGPTVQSNLHTVWNFVVNIWNNYLSVPFVYVWDKLVVGILWKVFQGGLTALGVK